MELDLSLLEPTELEKMDRPDFLRAAAASNRRFARLDVPGAGAWGLIVSVGLLIRLRDYRGQGRAFAASLSEASKAEAAQILGRVINATMAEIYELNDQIEFWINAPDGTPLPDGFVGSWEVALLGRDMVQSTLEFVRATGLDFAAYHKSSLDALRGADAIGRELAASLDVFEEIEGIPLLVAAHRRGQWWGLPAVF